MLTITTDNHEDFLEEIGLRYVTDAESGFRRKRKGKGFMYLDQEGNKVSSDPILKRIASLVIPPAWESVWICRKPNGHLQATGRDQRERKQYRYHPKWTHARNETKFDGLKHMGEWLKILRPQIEIDFARNDLSREKILATVIKVMEQTHIRIGNDTYAEENGSYGLTTLKNSHVNVKGTKTLFKFKGKSGVLHESTLDDARLSRIIRKCQDIPGNELFGYIDDDGKPQDISSQHVNSYLQQIVGEPLTAKDFRTWGASRKAVEILLERPTLEKPSEKAFKKLECQMIKLTAEAMGNTVAVCRKYYVHPKVFDSFAEGQLHKLGRKIKKADQIFSREEKILLELLI